MQKMTVTQFRAYCEAHRFSSYSFDVDRQSWDTVYNPMRLRESFRELHTFLAPASVCLVNPYGSLCLESVKYILLLREFESGAAEFSVVCGDRKTDAGDLTYLICADPIMFPF